MKIEYLKAADVCKYYNKKQILKNTSLSLYKNEILSLLGPNGAGKTTFIKILSTILSKDSGHVTILGLDLDKHENEIKKYIGYVGQDTDRSAYARLTPKENLLFFGKLHGLNKKTILNQLDKLIHYFEFGKNIDKLFMHLSGGQKQTVIIMRALLHDPMIVFLDEPTKGLDPISSINLRNFLKKYIKTENKSMILTSHILSEVEILSDRITFIKNGRIDICDSLKNIIAKVGVNDFIEIKKKHLTNKIIGNITKIKSVKFKEELSKGWISFGITNFYEAVEEIIQYLKKEKLITEFRHRSVSLEDAFIKCIGSINENFEI